MPHINEAQRREIQRLLALDAVELDRNMALSVDSETRKRVEANVKRLMYEQERKIIEDDVMNLWGAEFFNLVREQLVSHFRAKVATFHDIIHKAVCIDFGYCDRRRKSDLGLEEYALVLAVADALATAKTGIPLPITTVSVYLVKRQILDKWCCCAE
jgi:hypothetical protein